MKKSVDLTPQSVIIDYMRLVSGEEFLDEVEKGMSNLEKDMQRSPEQYKEYIEEISQVDPDYPTHGGYMLVNHQDMEHMGGEKPCFHNVDDAVQWAEYNLDHNCYNIYQIKVVV